MDQMFTIAKWSSFQEYRYSKKTYMIGTSGLSYKIITIVIMMIAVTLQIVASLMIVIDDTS